MPKKIFTEEEKSQIITEYQAGGISAKKLGEKFGCSGPTILKNLKEWGVQPKQKKLDLTGQIFGRLTAIEPAPKRDDKYSRWKCLCSCGEEVEVRTDYLTSGHTLSCGCLTREPSKNLIDLTGQTFGEWTVTSRGNKEGYWNCKCSCGVKREVYGSSLKQGKSLSCGHLANGKIKKPIIGNRYGNLIVLEQFKQDQIWYCKCQCDCGNTTLVKRQNLISGNTQSCGCIVSKGEARIKRLLQENNVPFISQWMPDDISNAKYRFDFYVDSRYVIEFDGPQHAGQVSGYYTEDRVKELMARDIEKNKYCILHNIPIYRIPYECRDTITFDQLTSEKFLVNMEEAQDE